MIAHAATVVDPTSVWDYAITLLFGITAVTMLGAWVVITFPARPVYKGTQSPPMLGLQVAAGLVWLASMLVCNDHFAWLTTVEVSACPVWSLWAQIAFGVNLWFSLMALRSYDLFRSHVMMRKPPRWSRSAMFALLVLPMFVLCLVAQNTDACVPDEAMMDCHTEHGFKVAITVILCVNFATVGVFSALVLREKTPPHYTQHKSILVATFLSAPFAAIGVAINLLDLTPTEAGRCTLAACAFFCVNAGFWAVAGSTFARIVGLSRGLNEVHAVRSKDKFELTAPDEELRRDDGTAFQRWRYTDFARNDAMMQFYVQWACRQPRSATVAYHALYCSEISSAPLMRSVSLREVGLIYRDVCAWITIPRETAAAFARRCTQNDEAMRIFHDLEIEPEEVTAEELLRVADYMRDRVLEPGYELFCREPNILREVHEHLLRVGMPLHD